MGSRPRGRLGATLPQLLYNPNGDRASSALAIRDGPSIALADAKLARRPRRNSGGPARPWLRLIGGQIGRGQPFNTMSVTDLSQARS
ncbi:hypothetical protein SAMN05519103_09638 [Rhizobiales bacterium GAS113]|nr:hypothetical protein SAMN05519103_09638 [Rhizobiales bacterium GAS113]